MYLFKKYRKNEKTMSKKTPDIAFDPTINEIIQDFSFLYFLISINSKIKNDNIYRLLDYFCCFIFPVFCDELIKKGYLDDINLSEQSKKDINNIKKARTLILKAVPKSNSNYIKTINRLAGINHDEYVLDICIIKYAKQLIAINYSEFLFSSFNDCQKATLRDMLFLPKAILESFYKAIGQSFNELDKKIQIEAEKTARQLDKQHNMKIYSYSSNLLFKNSRISNEDKPYLLFRYSIVSISLLLELLVPVRFSMHCDGLFQIDSDKTILKIKAIIIEMLFNDKKNGTAFTDKLLEYAAKSVVDSNFFIVNRKLRDNIHYSLTQDISEEEYAVILRNQNNYLKAVQEKMLDEFSIKNYRRINILAKVLIWANYKEVSL